MPLNNPQRFDMILKNKEMKANWVTSICVSNLKYINPEAVGIFAVYSTLLLPIKCCNLINDFIIFHYIFKILSIKCCHLLFNSWYRSWITFSFSFSFSFSEIFLARNHGRLWVKRLIIIMAISWLLLTHLNSYFLMTHELTGFPLWQQYWCFYLKRSEGFYFFVGNNEEF